MSLVPIPPYNKSNKPDYGEYEEKLVESIKKRRSVEDTDMLSDATVNLSCIIVKVS